MVGFEIWVLGYLVPLFIFLYIELTHGHNHLVLIEVNVMKCA